MNYINKDIVKLKSIFPTIRLFTNQLTYDILKKNKTKEKRLKMEDIEKWGIAVLGNNITVHKGATVEAKAMIYSDVKAGE